MLLAFECAPNCLLESIAYRAGKKIEWDPVQLRAKNCPEAEPLIRKEFRKGWNL